MIKKAWLWLSAAAIGVYSLFQTYAQQIDWVFVAMLVTVGIGLFFVYDLMRFVKESNG